MDEDLSTGVETPKQKMVRKIEEEIAREYQRDLQEWYKLHKYDLVCCNGSSSEFKL